MKLFLSSKDIPSLSSLNSDKRNESVYKAQQKLEVPQKLTLSLLKLVLLTPPFIFLARQEWLILTITIVLSAIGYMLIFRPLFFNFINKLLTKD
ncbi:DUF6170 family protein [Thalassotalea montiporae]